jgi:hypothetical protein
MGSLLVGSFLQLLLCAAPLCCDMCNTDACMLHVLLSWHDKVDAAVYHNCQRAQLRVASGMTQAPLCAGMPAWLQQTGSGLCKRHLAGQLVSQGC